MTGQRIGYIRVSSSDQNPDRQLVGLVLDKKFIDYCSGKDLNRPEFVKMISYVREGDTVVIDSMDRLARNMEDLKKTIFNLTSKKIKVQFIKEALNFTGEDSPRDNFLLSIMGSLAEFERALIRERQREGIEIAKKNGKYKGRPSIPKSKIRELTLKVKQGENRSKLARELGISRTSLYKYLRAQ